MWNFNSPKKIDKQWQNHGESIDRWTTRSAFQLPPGPGPSCMTRCPSIHGFHPQLKSDEGCLKSHLLSSNYMLAAWCYSHQYDSIIFDDFKFHQVLERFATVLVAWKATWRELMSPQISEWRWIASIFNFQIMGIIIHHHIHLIYIYIIQVHIKSYEIHHGHYWYLSSLPPFFWGTALLSRQFRGFAPLSRYPESWKQLWVSDFQPLQMISNAEIPAHKYIVNHKYLDLLVW